MSSLYTLLLWLETAFKARAASRNPEAGQGLVEYALILVLVSVLVSVLLIVLGPTVANMFQTVYDSFTAAQQQ